MKCLGFLSITLFMMGCVARGVQLDHAQIEHFEPGVTSYDQVLSELGKPSSRTVDSEGDIHLYYTHSFYSIKPETFLPVVGGHVGGMNNATQSVVFSFNSDGVMKDSSYSKMKTDAAGAF